MKSRECARIGRVIDTFRFASGTTPAPNIAMKRILLPVLAVLLAAPAFAATTGSATKPVGASADLTTSTSGAVDSYSGAYATEGWYQPAAAFDDILPVDSDTGNNRALISSAGGASDTSQTSPRWIVWKFNDATAVNAIGVYPYGIWGSANRCPMNWTFDASNDGSTWTTLDTRTGETAWTEFAYRYFEFQNDTAYQYYRFYCTSLNAADKYLFLGELEFYYVASATAPVVTDGGAAVSGTSATITGSLDALGAGASSATVTLEYGTTAALGSSATVGTYADATDPISATLTGLSYGTTYYYAFKAVNNAPTPQTGWSETNSFVVEASTRFSDTLGIATSNCRTTVTGAIESWGLGTTEASLLVGASANDLAVVQTVPLSAEPANDEVAFDSFTRAAGTWYVAIRAVTTYNGGVWTNDTAATAVTLADAATYTWKGGAGAWGDPAMWTTTDSDAGGYPTAGCSVVFPAYAKIESVVSLSANPGTLAAITIDSASRYTFRSTSRSSVRTITAPTKTMTGAGGGTLVLDAVSIKGTEDKNRFDTLAGLRRLVLENSAEFAYPREAANSQLELSLVSGGKFAPYWTSGVHVGKLKVGRSITYIEPAGSNAMIFDGFENIGDMGYCRLSSDAAGKVSFADVSGIAQIGGEGTFENNPSQIKVAPEFTFYIGTWHQNKGIAAISNNVVVALSASTMLQGFDGATSLDNVYVGSATTLTENKTVNAVMLENDLDLGGHTLTVVSGVVRMGPNGNGTVKNGTLRVLRPLLAMDNTNNTTERFTAEIETVGNDDPWTAMFDMWSLGGSKPKASFSNFVGRVIWPFNTFTFKSGFTATNYVVDVKSGSVGTGSHNADYVVRGIAGNCELKTGMFNNTVWVGDCNDDQFAKLGQNAIANWGYVVSTNGILAPGVLSYDGGRRGRMFMVSTKERMVNFLMDEGGTLQIAIHADGDNTYLKMTDIDTSYSWSTYINVTLAGTLDIREYGKIQTGVAYPVVFYHPGKRTGKFDRVTINGAPRSGTGYVVEYDVPQADGSHAVTVTRRPNGTVIVIR
jgi:hypothetical protein